MQNDEIEELFKKIASTPGVSQLAIFDADGNLLKTNIDSQELIEKIISKSLVLLDTVFSTLKKYGSGDKINLLSIRVNTDRGNIYVIRGKYFSLAFLQQAGLTIDEKKIIQMLQKIQEKFT